MNTALKRPIQLSDYSLVGRDSAAAVEKGLAEATWYASPVAKEDLRVLLTRKNGPAIRDTIIWFGLLFLFGAAGYALWGSPWAVIPFAIYGVIYASSSDSRWHEAGHGTAFKSDWMNNVLYEIASFMVLRESTPWRWSHTRHHSDTIIVGRDPEIAVPRPTSVWMLVASFFNLGAFRKFVRTLALHLRGRLTDEERTYIPDAAAHSVYARARIYVAIYASVLALSIATQSILPLMYVGLPTFYGAWLMSVYGFTQHAGLAENVLDHRLNCRTVYMNPVNRFLYWNMNYHLEHHMFPLVPYHALPRLHALIKSDSPTPYNGLVQAYREIIPALLRQIKDPAWHVMRVLPTPTYPAEAPQIAKPIIVDPVTDGTGWIAIGPGSLLQRADVIRVDSANQTYAVYRAADGGCYATDGICTHGNAHLADGMVKGTQIECPKHNGRFDIRDGSPQRAPVCLALRTYPVRERNGVLEMDVSSAGGLALTSPAPVHAFRVVSNENVATFIKELVLEPESETLPLNYKPGDYLQFDIPVYAPRSLEHVSVGQPYAIVWQAQHVFEFVSGNEMACRRNYSFATNPARESQLKFNVRIATPPRGQACNAGVGSSYLFGLKPGDHVTAVGPFGEFHIKPGMREMVYIGGGAGMAPLRSHLSNLLETTRTERRISYWYGARSRQELFYTDYFESLAARHANFKFNLALSEPLSEDAWTGPIGFIHDVVREAYLGSHPDPRNVEYYLCGPPPMIKATITMLNDFGVSPANISYDEF